MKLLITILFFIIGVKINAMNLLDYKVDEKKIILEDWKFFSDQVMGGVSEGKTALKKDKNKFFLRLEGTVSTENNGGFIQVRKEYEIKNDTYKGIRFKARGLESEYYVHVRTKKLFLPWQYYAGKFFVSKEWTNVEIKFDDFTKSNFYQPQNFKSSEIRSIAFVAFGKDFDAKLDIIEAELF
ncbi:MAG: NADH:ubiquinone oxidoreductase [Rickettsiales bacterium]|nr:NADH:ubiquinone oxidoreductase [Rickettsiales bacterium]RPG16274.1 MAG: NADH:ubiquinone oxidoreductase [Pelagibacteraceae bacterium TMED195]|tara:strand:- start:4442 stop:4987 length:546 start_codon:yes stop_codon:yes gene_type:complete